MIHRDITSIKVILLYRIKKNKSNKNYVFKMYSLPIG